MTSTIITGSNGRFGVQGLFKGQEPAILGDFGRVHLVVGAIYHSHLEINHFVPKTPALAALNAVVDGGNVFPGNDAANDFVFKASLTGSVSIISIMQ